jgi:hypothetical protein
MLISLRTLINTTLFRFIAVLWFWLYTKYDSEPAKYLLYIIWRDQLWNIEITNPTSSINTGTVEYLSNQLIAERLWNIEQLCSKSVRLSLYDQTNTIQTPSLPTTISEPVIQTTGTTSVLPIIDNSSLLRNN